VVRGKNVPYAKMGEKKSRPHIEHPSENAGGNSNNATSVKKIDLYCVGGGNTNIMES